MFEAIFQSFFDFHDFKEFLNENKVVGTVIGVIIAYSAWELIQSLVGDIILPSAYLLIFQRINTKYTSGIFEPMNKLNIPNFIKEVLSFFIVIFVTFTLVYHIINNNLLNNKVNEQPNENINDDINIHIKKNK
jgi:large-conductance mechanosensitive channel